MYELLVLALLMHAPLHAYRIAKIANEIIGPEEQISTGTLSTLLSRLVRVGFISFVEEESAAASSDRTLREYQLTEAGRARFLVLMLDIASHPGTQSKLFHIKALHLEFLPLDRQLFLVEHYLNHCQGLLRIKQDDAQSIQHKSLKKGYSSMSSPLLRARAQAFIQLKIVHWQHEIAWAEALRAQILAQLQQGEQSPPSDDVVIVVQQ